MPAIPDAKLLIEQWEREACDMPRPWWDYWKIRVVIVVTVGITALWIGVIGWAIWMVM